MTFLRNSDERRRGIRRRASQTATLENMVADLTQRLRAGQVDPTHVSLAAALGDEVARAVVPSSPGPLGMLWPTSGGRWIADADAWGRLMTSDADRLWPHLDGVEPIALLRLGYAAYQLPLSLYREAYGFRSLSAWAAGIDGVMEGTMQPDEVASEYATPQAVTSYVDEFLRQQQLFGRGASDPRHVFEVGAAAQTFQLAADELGGIGDDIETPDLQGGTMAAAGHLLYALEKLMVPDAGDMRLSERIAAALRWCSVAVNRGVAAGGDDFGALAAGGWLRVLDHLRRAGFPRSLIQ